MPVYNIRYAKIEDIDLIRRLTFLVWPQTYSSIISESQINYMLEMMYSDSSLQKQMMEGAKFIIAFDEDEPVGFASYQETDPTVFKLHKLYVLPSQQGKGTGKFIINYIINDIKPTGATALYLQVNRRNNARNFYEKEGFVVTGEFDFDIGNGFVMDDYVMEKKL